MLGNWIKTTTTTTGTGDLTLSSVTNFATFNDVFGVGPLFYYAILDDSTDAPIEMGIGHLSASTTLVRDKVLTTMVSGTYDDTAPAAVTLASGTKRVICTPDAGALAVNPINLSTAASSRVLSPYMPSSAGTLVATANRCYYVPLLLATPREVDAVVFRVSSGAASTTAKAGLYAAGIDGKPGARLAQSGSIDTSGPGKMSGTFTSKRYPPGLYYLAVASSGTPTLNSVTGASIAQDPLLGADSTGVQFVGGLYEALSGGWTDLPTTASGSLTEVIGVSGVPTLGLRVAA